MIADIFGHTANGLAIPCFRWKGKGREILVLGGVHGDEPEGVIASFGLLSAWNREFSYPFSLTLVPTLNLDGVIARTRINARGVDLNRNLPTKDWDPKAHQPRYQPGPAPGSEPENQALIRFLSEHDPALVLSLHSWNPVLNVNGACHRIAQAIASHINYEVKDDIGYPTPGSLGTYWGQDKTRAVLTYEIERGLPADKIIALHVPVIIEGLKHDL